MPRTYKRRFDHDEARERADAGETVGDLARAYGVSWAAVKRIIDPATNARMDAASRSWLKAGMCRDCGKEGVTRYGHGGRGRSRCKDCANRAMTLANDTHAYCCTCHKWKPRDEFTKDRSMPVRGLSNECRPCQTTRRKAYRDARKVPCVDCGVPVHSTAPGNGRRTNVARCLSCAAKAHYA